LLACLKESCVTRLLLLLLLAASSTASAVVVRDDVDDAKYRMQASEFPALVDMPGEGHGVLIAPQWVVTAAHVIPAHAETGQVVINGIPRSVKRVVVHPGHKRPPQALADQALATWDWTLFIVLLSSSDDIALLKLAAPVTDVSPVPLHEGTDEYGQVVRIIGKGATADGVAGYDMHSPHRTELRRAYNKVTSAHDRWFCYVFDKPSEGLPLEGGSGGGDSGGPVLIETGKAWRLAGLTSWTAPHQGATRVPFGQYGQISCNVRLRHYGAWIESVMSEPPQTGR
jgi:chymotrypsin